MEPVTPNQIGPAAYHFWVERGAWSIELLAVGIIIGFTLIATINWFYQMLAHRQLIVAQYQRYRDRLGRSLLLGLEILVAADVVRTVALEPTLINILGLGLLVVIRTFLSWSIVLEIEGRWPWEPRIPANEKEERQS